ncbi:GAF domain-containing protein [Lentzea sp. PSKA42]|uniref:Sensor-like histidine kinase SenX3 n=1 Tax=Lentzea indica TaxID=2604800 RepID=A0ABX1FYV2_9PSEU|nr:ATP-binding protein [Lentzea indica]NKE63646.1 GAF domain-containing protein [Lentzea indica]
MSSGPSFRRLLVLTFGPLVAVVLVLLALGAGAVSVAASSVEELTSRVQPMQQLNFELRGIMLDSSRGLRGYTYSGDVALVEAYDSGHQNYVRVKDELVRLAEVGEQRPARSVAELADRWFAMTAAVRAAEPGTADTPARLVAGAAVIDEFLETSTRLAEGLEAQSASLRQSSAATRRQAMVALISCGAVAVLLATGSAITTVQRLGRSIAALRNTVTRWEGGDALARIPEQGIAELQQVARSINALADEAAKLHEVEQERQRHREIAADIGMSIREHLDVDAVIELAASEIGQHFGVERVCVWLAEGEPEDTSADLVTPEWHRPELAPLGSSLATQDRSLPMAPLRRLYAGRRSLEVDHADEAGRLGLPAALRDRSVLVLPLGRGESVLGALVVARSGGGWPAVEVDALEHIAADLARGVDQARLYQEQQLLVRELRALDRNKTEFVSNVSHELRTPMTSIAGYVELLRDGAGGTINGSQRKMLDVVHRNMTRLRGLIEELLLLAKLESDTVTMAEKPVDVGELVDGVVQALRPAADVGGVHLDHENAGGLVVCGDAAQLDRVLTNLLSNAVKFTPAGGDVRVTSRRCGGGWVEVKVSDTGMGVPKAEQHAMFTRFFRASNATEQAIPGSGLGLAIARQIVRRHGGQVSLTSTEGVGTTVTVLLPDGWTGETP